MRLVRPFSDQRHTKMAIIQLELHGTGCINWVNPVAERAMTPSQKSSYSEHSSLAFLRLPTVRRMTGLGRSTIYRLMARNEFPSPVHLGVRAVAWRRTDLEIWAQTRKPIR